MTNGPYRTVNGVLMHRCSRCRRWKRAEGNFSHHSGKKQGGYQPYCKRCADEYRMAHVEKNHAYQAKYRARNMYNTTVSALDELLRKQGFSCGICGKGIEDDRDRVVDHDHATGRVRGFLCRNCNAALGLMRDSIDILKGAIRYLRKAGKEG